LRATPAPAVFASTTRKRRNQRMTLQDILKAKGSSVFTIGPEATLNEAAKTLVRHNIGSLLVCRSESVAVADLAGIITERDLLHSCASGGCGLSDTKVQDVMTTKIVTGLPGDSVEQTMGLLTSKRIRHLPVVSEGRLIGMVSIGDVVKAQHDRLAMENRFMKDYIQS
jgi:CBS domain-containing protein